MFSFLTMCFYRLCCNITWKRRMFVPVYDYQRAKQQYLTLLNDIVSKKREQILNWKYFKIFKIPVMQGSWREGHSWRKGGKFSKYFFVFSNDCQLCSVDALQMTSLLFNINCHSRVKHWEWSIMIIRVHNTSVKKGSKKVCQWV